MQVSANALRSGGAVVWAGQYYTRKITVGNLLLSSGSDSSHTIAGPRLKDIVCNALETQKAPASPSPRSMDETLECFHHFNVPSLPHLLALTTHPSGSFPPPKTSLIVIDAISSLFTLAFPKTIEKIDSKRDPGKKNDAAQWAVSRRWGVMSDFVSKIGKLAATSNIAVLLISQSTTRVRAQSDTVLHPAISGTAWDNGINARLALFRNWLLKPNEGSRQGNYVPKARFVGIIKAAGITYDGLGRVVPFTIKQVGRG